MRRRHVPAVLSIEVLSYPRPWTETVFNNELEMARRGERNYLVARHGSRVVGYAGLMFALDEAHITKVTVLPAYRQRGIGREVLEWLLRRAEQEARKAGFTAMRLEVATTNTHAIALYHKLGYVTFAHKAGYYEDGQDALRMQKEL